MFLTEKDLRDAFWKNYNYSKRALKYQFECDVRPGAADLVTVEQFQGNYQINAFEFKLSDIKKAILQAKENAKFVNKSWIVIPDEKKEFTTMTITTYGDDATAKQIIRQVNKVQEVVASDLKAGEA